LVAVIGRHPLGVFLGVVLALPAAGCMGGDAGEPRIREDDLRKLVLQPDDLPSRFTRFDFGELAVTDARPGPRADELRFGRVGGWKARYRRSGTADTAGPLIVESRVDLFEDEDGAKQDLDAYAAELEQTVERFAGPGRSLEPPKIGEGSAAMTLRQASAGGGVRFFTVAWRRAQLTASISLNGFEGKLTIDDAVMLARRQDRRLATALQD
jgi:hypothetical protein